MISTRKRWLPFVVLLCSISYIPSTFGQETQKYQVFKLENSIGTEEISSLTTADGTSNHIVIRTQDRGLNLLLTADLATSNSGLKFVSTGHTSRYKQETLDTLIEVDSGFPFSQNGSMKMREVLIAFWLKAGRPRIVKSALDGSDINIHEIIQSDTALANRGFKVFQINHGLDEIFWTDTDGKSVFLTTTDSEGDRREVIAEGYLPQLSSLNRQSTQYLLQAYKDNSSSMGKPYNVIAILGGDIIDVSRSGEVQKNTMILIINGKIDYIGAVNNSLIPSGAHIIDATNKFLIPGLWDMHVHLFHPSYLQRALLSGVTTVRDMGNEFDSIVQMKDMVNKGSVPAPNLYAAGLLDGKSSATLGIMMATNADEIKANVKRYHEAGFNQIKVYGSVKKNDFNTIVAEAKRYQMPVVGHLPTGYTLSYFINNGLNSLSHIHFFMNNLKWSAGDLKVANKVLLGDMIAKHTYLDPTLNIYRLTKDKKVGSYYKIVKMFVDYGIPIVAGTDNEGTIPEEIQNYVQLGLSPLEAIRAATIVPATLMVAAKESGSIEMGKRGDLLILDENPLLNIGTLNKIRTIVKGQFVIHK
jgi:imidazolonepropionase-like amidohydrolase